MLPVMNKKSRTRLARFAWLVTVVMGLYAALSVQSVVATFTGGYDAMGKSYREDLVAARADALAQSDETQWQTKTMLYAKMFGRNRLEQANEKQFQSFLSAIDASVKQMTSGTSKLAALLSLAASLLLVASFFHLAKLASAYRHEALDDVGTAYRLKKAAVLLWCRAPLTLAAAVSLAIGEWDLAKVLAQLGEPGVGVIHLPQAYTTLPTELFPTTSGATALVMGVLLYAAGKILEGRGQMEKELEGTV